MGGEPDPENIQGAPAPGQGPGGERVPEDLPPEPEVVYITFPKVKGSMGLSIVAAKGENQEKRGIYVKSVVPGGGAAQDGRLAAGDQLLEVDGNNLVGLSQENAAELMKHTGQVVTLKVARQAAIYHRLATLLSQPSPVMQRAAATSPHPQGPAAATPTKQRPRSEDVGRFNGPHDGAPGEQWKGGGPGGPDYVNQGHMMDPRQRPLNQQMGARSSPALNTHPGDPYGQHRGGPPQGGPGGPHMPGAPPHHPGMQESPRGDPSRSKSTSHLEHPDVAQDPRHVQSSSALPRPQGPGPQKYASQPDLNRRPDDPRGMDPRDPRHNYENYPEHSAHPPHNKNDPYGQDPRYATAPKAGMPNYVNHAELANQYPRTAQSMSNIREDPYNRPPEFGGLNRTKSEEMDHSRVREWQQRNEMAERERWEDPRHGGMQRPQPGEDIPRSQANNQQYQQNFYQNTMPRTQEPEPPFDQMRRPPGLEEQRPPTKPKPSVAPKPAVAPKPPVEQPDIPRMQTDNRKTQQHFFDPRQPQQQPGPYASQANVPANVQQGRYQTVTSTTETRTVHSQRVQDPHHRDKLSPGGAHDRQTTTPELPPPPADLIPDMPGEDGGNDDLPPPPPPPPNEYEPQMREEQMMRDMQGPGYGGRGPPPQNRHPGPYDPRAPTPGQQQQQGRDPYGNRMPPGPQGQYRDPRDPRFQGQAQMSPGNQPKASPTGHPGQQNYRDYQNLPPPGQGRPGYGGPEGQRMGPGGPPYESRGPQQAPPSEPQYPYQPRPAGPGGLNEPPMSQQQQQQHPYQNPPTSQQYQTPPPSSQYQPPPNSSQYRPPTSQYQPPGRQTGPPGSEPHMQRLDSEASSSRTTSVSSLKPRVQVLPAGPPPHKDATSSPWEREEREKMKKQREEDLRIMRDQEIEELESRPHMSQEEQERLRRLRLDQEFERRVAETKDKNEDDDSDGDITERAAGRVRMLRLMQEEIEKKKQLSQRDDLQRNDTEKDERAERRIQMFEQQREEEKMRQQKRVERRVAETQDYLNKQRDLRERQRKEQEEHQRLARLEDERLREKQREELRRKKEAERDQLREMAVAREEEERAMREAKQRADERQRNMEQEFGRLQFSDGGAPYRGGDQQQQQQHNPPRLGPPPPERRSSYDPTAYRPGSNPNLAAPGQYDPNQGPGQRGNNSSALRQPEVMSMSMAKKSVSFDSNLATEIQEQRRYASQSSAESGHVQSPTAEFNHNGQDSNYPYRGPNSLPPEQGYGYRGPSSGQPEPVPNLQRPSYGGSQGPPATPMTPGTNEVFRTPENARDPNVKLVIGDTPGVVGANEVYRDPRDRIAANRNQKAGDTAGERMSFRDKMKMFALEAGENTPQERPKVSRKQREIESSMNGR